MKTLNKLQVHYCSIENEPTSTKNWQHVGNVFWIFLIHYIIKNTKIKDSFKKVTILLKRTIIWSYKGTTLKVDVWNLLNKLILGIYFTKSQVGNRSVDVILNIWTIYLHINGKKDGVKSKVTTLTKQSNK